ncbi:hypothetical protein M768_07840 [Cellulosimicrobium cellulans F16]|uniref:Uncharacterized protein n=1 Tax=Cellulosimicrobium cellulans F16 TaxID=1350482 RepID=A0A0M0F9G5_CELCE|nr:hypothetical protein M768_07840 [Cellulosimicrobium cellulans F16]
MAGSIAFVWTSDVKTSEPDVYIATWPAANAWFIVPQSRRKLLPRELSSQRMALSHSSASLVPSLVSVEVAVPSSATSCVRPPRANVLTVSCQPPVLFCDICM